METKAPDVYTEGHPCYNLLKMILQTPAPEYVIKHEDLMAQIQETDRLAMKFNVNLVLRHKSELEVALLRLKLKQLEIADAEAKLLEEPKRKNPDAASEALLAQLKSELETLGDRFQLQRLILAEAEAQIKGVHEWRLTRMAQIKGVHEWRLTRMTQLTTMAQ